MTVDYSMPRMSGLTEATALRDQARQKVSSASFCVDASGVEVITTPMVIVLLAIDDALHEAGATLAVKEPADAFVAAFSDLGLYTRLMQMEFV